MLRTLVTLALTSAALVPATATSSAALVPATATSSAGVFPGDDGTIAYARPSGVWTVDPDGSNAELVIPDGFSPAWSPDGSRIAYVRFGADFADIYVADADGSNEVRITRSGENLEPTFSADGSRVIFVRSGRRTDIASKAADGTGPLTRLTDSPRFQELLPSASPDGTSIAFSGASQGDDLDVYAIDADGGHRRRLTASGRDDFGSSWSPDSAEIAFTRIGGRGRVDDVFLMDADGGNVRRLTSSPKADVGQSFSPQGTRIVIMRCCWGRVERPRLALIDADGSNRTPLVRYGFDADWQAI